MIFNKLLGKVLCNIMQTKILSVSKVDYNNSEAAF